MNEGSRSSFVCSFSLDDLNLGLQVALPQLCIEISSMPCAWGGSMEMHIQDIQVKAAIQELVYVLSRSLDPPHPFIMNTSHILLLLSPQPHHQHGLQIGVIASRDLFPFISNGLDRLRCRIYTSLSVRVRVSAQTRLSEMRTMATS